ncbi:hypothetical protein CMV_016581 [Castanea mollissima]|uniref:Uncharacterized protein n=1 Tax=Castanea mollissima TaxID=60419 RepID=A0A8J4VEX8_9ROSI|nr:hypothetical protein CMV_016581 [Castanea mollissima]
MVWQIRSRARTVMSRMAVLSSSSVYGDSFHCSPFSGITNSFVGFSRNWANPNATQWSKNMESHLRLLPSVKHINATVTFAADPEDKDVHFS